MPERKPIESAEQADALPIGSIIAEITEPDAPAVACKNRHGFWQFLGDASNRVYGSREMFPTVLSVVLLYTPTPVPTTNEGDPT